MGCLEEHEKREILDRFWRAQEAIRRESQRRYRRVHEAAARAEDPYTERLLAWAIDNWDLVSSISYEGAPGLFGKVFDVLPPDLRADMEKSSVSAPPTKELTAEDRERLGLGELYHEEKSRFGEPCPETEARLEELNARWKARGGTITVESLKELHRRIVEASRVDDPADLEG